MQKQTLSFKLMRTINPAAKKLKKAKDLSNKTELQ